MIIKLHLSLIVFLLYNLFLGKSDIFIMSYMFIIMHELSHMIIALCLNIDISEIELMPFGVNAKYIGKISLIKELLISLAGPIVSLLCAVLYDNEIYCLINIVIVLFNLIPIYPLDGGRILKVLLKVIFGEKNGNKFSICITNFLVVLFFLISLFIAAYLKNFTFLILTIYILKISKNEMQKDKIITAINYLQTDE